MLADSKLAGVDSRTQKPKGTNLTEDDELKGKTVFGEIGTKNDPGRQAEQDQLKRNNNSGAVDLKDLAQGGDSKFSALERESST